MEVDEVETGQLLQRFGCMQTVDHADLIEQMRRLIGEDFSESKASFYLEMSNWNVQTAVGYYYDLEAGSGAVGGGVGPNPNDTPMPSMSFLRDVTVGEGESVPPSTDFVKTWAVRNSGKMAWPPGCVLKLASGQNLAANAAASVSVHALAPETEMNLSLQMRSPDAPGIYESQWRMATPTGSYFGDPIWCILTVEPAGTMALTQQLNAFHVLDSSAANNSTSLFSTSAPSAIRPNSPTDANLSVMSPRDLLRPRTLSTSQSDNTIADTADNVAAADASNSVVIPEDEEMN